MSASRRKHIIPKYSCKKCGYICKTLFLFKQHCGTKKHITKMEAELTQYEIYKCMCGKTYKHIQSYNRHVKECKNTQTSLSNYTAYTDSYNHTDNNSGGEPDDFKSIITSLITQNQYMLMQNKEMREMVNEMIPKIGNNNTTIQNKFNLQIFLNETCKDAINLTDFVDTLELKSDDLENTGKNGFIAGITDIFVKGLKQIDLNRRPIHCSDLKREVLYVKDNNTWERDKDKNNMKQAINIVAKKQLDKIKVWEGENPDWNKTDAGTTKYIEMVRNLTNSGSEDNSENKIIKTIAKEVLIDKI